MKLRFLITVFPFIVLLGLTNTAWAEEQTCPSPQDYEYHGDPKPIEFTQSNSDTVIAMIEVLSTAHYRKLSINDELSQKLLNAYFEQLDPSKTYFLQSDIDAFTAKYSTLLDDYLRRGDLTAAGDIYLLYRDRAITRLEAAIAELKDPNVTYTFDTDEALPVDRDLYAWSKDEAEADQLWNRLIKLGLLNLKLSGQTLEEAREKVARRYTSQLSYLKQQKTIHVVDQYLNALGHLYDPHTDYFSPRSSENFEINMSLSLEGIGAVLQTVDELTSVVSVVPGGPAELGGQLSPGDRITGIAEGTDCEFIDVVGWRIDEVVELIRGPKGTTVRLETIPKEVDEFSEKREIITIVRDRVKLEDNAAKSEVIEMDYEGQTYRVGVIDIPSFYLDVDALQKGDKDYRSTTRDVHDLIEKLQSEEGGIDGLILDLRANGGGSLLESATLTDLFVDPGPVVQIRDQNNRINRQNRARQSAFYKGPLVVLIDRLSASASEIFAGAIQDYNRGLVVGSQTFGKGTVQTVLPLPEGQIKITESKFYRISGDSTQHRGVTPDIILPSLYDPKEIGASASENALDWDQITGIPHKSYNDWQEILPLIEKNQKARLNTNSDMQYLQRSIALDQELRAKEYVSLNEQTRLIEKKALEEKRLTLENEWRTTLGLPLKTSEELANETAAIELGEITEENEEEKLPDVLLDESARILIDYIRDTTSSPRVLVTN